MLHKHLTFVLGFEKVLRALIYPRLIMGLVRFNWIHSILFSLTWAQHQGLIYAILYLNFDIFSSLAIGHITSIDFGVMFHFVLLYVYYLFLNEWFF